MLLSWGSYHSESLIIRIVTETIENHRDAFLRMMVESMLAPTAEAISTLYRPSRLKLESGK